MRLNLGCGQNHLEGFVNVDKYAQAHPDVLQDLEQFPWIWGDSSVSEVIFHHVLEHLGQRTDDFLRIIQELYRVCRHDATVNIVVPHPRHDAFLNDPTHVRVITPELMGLFSLKNNEYWKSIGASNSPLALYLGVNFEIVAREAVLDDRLESRFRSGSLSGDAIRQAALSSNNVYSEYRMVLRVIK